MSLRLGGRWRCRFCPACGGASGVAHGAAQQAALQMSWPMIKRPCGQTGRMAKLQIHETIPGESTRECGDARAVLDRKYTRGAGRATKQRTSRRCQRQLAVSADASCGDCAAVYLAMNCPANTGHPAGWISSQATNVKIGVSAATVLRKIMGIFAGISLLPVQLSIIIGPSGLLCLDSTASTGSCPTCGSFFIAPASEPASWLVRRPLLAAYRAAISCWHSRLVSAASELLGDAR